LFIDGTRNWVRGEAAITRAALAAGAGMDAPHASL
jgi:hypothetical protein